MKKIYFLFVQILLLYSQAISAQVVISQIYGGGGVGGSPTYTNDFIELFNAGQTAQSINGWSVQYAGPNQSSWTKTNLTNFLLQPGQYYLIKGANNGSNGAALPTEDVSNTGMGLATDDGKVILVNNTTTQSGSNPTGSQIIDKVGYGGGPNGFEGVGPTGTDLTSTTSVSRLNSGCTDTNSNLLDFAVPGIPVARNSSITIAVCPNLSMSKHAISGLSLYPNPAKSSLFISSDNAAAKQIEVYNVLGKMVLSVKVTNEHVNVSALSTGVYLVKISEDGKTATRKLVIE